MNTAKHSELVNHIWAVADLLRGDYKASEYGQVILPFTVLRRLECVLEPTKQEVLEEAKQLEAEGNNDSTLRERFLRRAAGGQAFYNSSIYSLKKIVDDGDHVADHLQTYLNSFSENVQEIFAAYRFDQQIERLQRANLLYNVVGRFTDIDLRLHPLDEEGKPVLNDDGEKIEIVSNHQMGYVFEELIRKFSEQSNETAGEHFTPREVIELMTRLLIGTDNDALFVPGRSIRVLDPACGTGGMLTASKDLILDLNPDADVEVFGQELNAESWAVCRSELLIKGADSENIVLGNSFTEDGHAGEKFDYLLANPPFGVEWKKVQKFVEDEAKSGSGDNRFAAGNPVGLKGEKLPTTPRINDGSLLFLQHMISKMRPTEVKPGEAGEPDRITGGGRVAIVFNGSPLFTGAAASGESNIRKWIIENDMLEAVVALPDQLFYNTGISTYFWIVTNRKDADHQGRVILLDARDFFVKTRKSLGDKRKEIGNGRDGRPDQISVITEIYRDALDIARDPEHPHHKKVKVFPNEDFGYRRITVERPLKLRFAITSDTLTELRSAKPLQNLVNLGALIDALKPLVGQEWKTREEAFSAMRDAVAADGVAWPKMTAAASKAIRNIIGIRDRSGEEQKDKDGKPEPDPELRDFENIALDEDVDAYLEREVLPFAPDAWVDHEKTKIGYEIPFTRHFYEYKPPKPLAEIDAELKELEAEIQQLLGEVTE